MLREKETYKYFGTLEADTFKQVEIKEKIKTASDEREIISKPSIATEIS